MGNREWWLVYRRVLRSSPGAVNWRLPLDKDVALCDVAQLSKHRNDLHYRLRWFYDDLLYAKPHPSFGVFSSSAADTVVERLEDARGSDGMLILNQVLLGNTLSIVKALADESQRVKTIFDTLKDSIERSTNEVVRSWYTQVR